MLGTLGMKVWTNELSITTAINIRIVSNISKLSPSIKYCLIEN